MQEETKIIGFAKPEEQAEGESNCCLQVHNSFGEGRLILEWDKERIKGDNHKLQQGKFWLSVRKAFFTVKLIKEWTRLPIEIVKPLSLNTFRTWLDKALSNLIKLWSWLWTMGSPPEVFSNLNYSMGECEQTDCMCLMSTSNTFWSGTSYYLDAVLSGHDRNILDQSSSDPEALFLFQTYSIIQNISVPVLWLKKCGDFDFWQHHAALKR